jgi:hypothetical protein
MLVRLVWAFVFALSVLAPAQPLRAAELRITFDELTRLVQNIASETKIYLNSVPGGLFTTSSYVQIGSQSFALPTLDKKITKAGSTYAYNVREMTSTSVRVTPVSRALRLTLNFKTDGAVAVASCVAGDCPLLNFMPDIYWAAPVVSIDLVPFRYNGSISMKVDKVTIGGAPRTACRTSAGIFSCNIGLALARQSIATLKADIPAALKMALNDAGIQQRLADGLKAYLTVGQSGAVAINEVSIAPNTMTVNFRFNSDPAAK